MNIVSTNIGSPRTIEWKGELVQTGIYKYSTEESIFLGPEDVEKDSVIDRKYHGGVDKACYLYSADHYPWWQKFYHDLEIPFGMFGENLTIEGLQEKNIHIGDVFQAGEAIVQVTQPRQPCYKLGVRFGHPEVVKQFVKSGFSGVYVKVVKTGFVKSGDPLVCIEKKNSVSVHEVFELLYTSEFRKETLKLALDNLYLAESCRSDLLKRRKEFL